jgi:hypothetical protein
MKKLPTPIVMVFSPILVCVSAGIAYLVLAPIHPDFAKVVAGAILSSLVKVYNYLRDKEIKLSFLKSLETGDNIQHYSLRWYLIIIYGSLVLLGIINLLAGIGGALSSMNLGNPSGALVITTFIGIAISPVLFFFFGTWVGKKGGKHGVLALIITILLIETIDLLTILLIPESYIQKLANKTKGEFLQEIFSATFLTVKVTYTFVRILIALLGYWHGRRKRLVAQLQDLFRVLPNDIQTTVVDLVYEEATKISREKTTTTTTKA